MITSTKKSNNPAVFDATKNEKQKEFLNAVLTSTIDPTYRYFFYGGAIRGGKTSVCLILINLLAKKYPGSRWHIIRESMTTHEETTIPSYEKFTPTSSKMVLKYNRSTSNYYCEFVNGSKIFFVSENIKHDPDLDWMKGLETNGIFLEQMEGLAEETFNKALERTGSWYIDPMPPGIILGTFNPTQRWVKPRIKEAAQEGKLEAPFFFMEAFPKDNPFVTKEQWQAWENMDEISYKRFIEGDWEVTSVEKPFLYSFDKYEHVKECALNPNDALYISFDFNVDPICCVIGQFGTDWIHIIDEFRLKNSDLYELCDQIKSRYANNHIRVTGDASGMARTVTTKGNMNSYSIIQQELNISYRQVDLPRANPPISESRTLCNSILGRHKNVKIDPRCKYLIDDCLYVQVDDEGKIPKKANDQRTHLLDAFRYFLNSYKSGFIVQGY